MSLRCPSCHAECDEAQLRTLAAHIAPRYFCPACCIEVRYVPVAWWILLIAPAGVIAACVLLGVGWAMPQTRIACWVLAALVLAAAAALHYHFARPGLRTAG